MFGSWLGAKKRATSIVVDDLAGLRPYAQLPRATIESSLDLVERIHLKPGVIGDELPADRTLFLHSGSLQLQTVSGFVLHLDADSLQARFPLPDRSTLVSLYAAEPSAILVVPTELASDTDGLASQNPDIAKPDTLKLSAEESDAFEDLRAYFRKEHCELPSLPDLALKIGKAIDDRNNDNEDIARLIQLDPSLTARIISVVNSAAFGGLNKITSTAQATARLGRKKVRSLVYSCLLKSIFKVKSTTLKKRMESLWQHSASVAALSYVMGRETPGIDPEQALLAGLVHDIGAVAVIGGINKYPVLANREAVMNLAISSLRMEAGVRTLKQWKLQNEFAEVVRNSSNWYRIGSAIPDNTDVVILARMHALIGTPEQADLPRIDDVPAFSKLARGGLSPQQSLTLLEEAAEDVREVRALISGH